MPQEILQSAKDFLDFCRTAPDALRGVHRWRHFRSIPEHERETVETHSLQTALLGMGMLAIEMQECVPQGRTDLHPFRVLCACMIHDFGEPGSGDIRYSVKNDPRVKGILETIEHEYVERELSVFPESIREAFSDAYAVEQEAGKTTDGEFFRAIELVGYMLIAVPHVKKGRTEFIEVFRNHHHSLLCFSKRFKSVKELYEPYREFVEETLASS